VYVCVYLCMYLCVCVCCGRRAGTARARIQHDSGKRGRRSRECQGLRGMRHLDYAWTISVRALRLVCTHSPALSCSAKHSRGARCTINRCLERLQVCRSSPSAAAAAAAAAATWTVGGAMMCAGDQGDGLERARHPRVGCRIRERLDAEQGRSNHLPMHLPCILAPAASLQAHMVECCEC